MDETATSYKFTVSRYKAEAQAALHAGVETEAGIDMEGWLFQVKALDGRAVKLPRHGPLRAATPPRAAGNPSAKSPEKKSGGRRTGSGTQAHTPSTAASRGVFPTGMMIGPPAMQCREGPSATKCREEPMPPKAKDAADPIAEPAAVAVSSRHLCKQMAEGLSVERAPLAIQAGLLTHRIASHMLRTGTAPCHVHLTGSLSTLLCKRTLAIRGPGP